MPLPQPPLCKNQMCVLHDRDYQGACACWEWGLRGKFIAWCPMRRAYLAVSKRFFTAKSRSIRCDEWNAYQRSWRRENIDRWREYQRKYRATRKEKDR